MRFGLIRRSHEQKRRASSAFIGQHQQQPFQDVQRLDGISSLQQTSAVPSGYEHRRLSNASPSQPSLTTASSSSIDSLDDPSGRSIARRSLTLQGETFGGGTPRRRMSNIPVCDGSAAGQLLRSQSRKDSTDSTSCCDLQSSKLMSVISVMVIVALTTVAFALSIRYIYR